MATTVGLKFDMSASIGRFQKSMDRVERRLDSLDRSSRRAASGIGLLAKLQIGGALLKGVGMLSGAFRSATGSAQQFFTSTLERVDALGKLSSSIGVAVQPLQILGKAASEAGVGQDKLGEAFKRMNKRIAEATMGFGEALPALQRLGLDAAELSKMSPDQAFMKIGEAISGLPTKGLQAATAFKIFSDQGLSLIPLFEDFPAKIQATTERFNALGLGVNTVQTKNIESLNDTLGEVQSVIASIGGKVIGNIAPAIDIFLQQILSAVENFELGEAKGANALADYLTESIFKGAIVLGDFADRMIAGLFKAFAFMATIVERMMSVLGSLMPDAISDNGKAIMAQVQRDERILKNDEKNLKNNFLPRGKNREQYEAEIADKRETIKINRAAARTADEEFIRGKYGITSEDSLPKVGQAARFGAEQLALGKIEAAASSKGIDSSVAMAKRLGVDTDKVRKLAAKRSLDIKVQEELAAERAQNAKDIADIDAKREKREQQQKRPPQFDRKDPKQLPGFDAGEQGRKLAGFDLLGPLADVPGIAGRIARQLSGAAAAGLAAENDPQVQAFAERQSEIDRLRRAGELAADMNKRTASAELEIFKKTAERNVEQFRANPMAARIAASQGMSVDDFVNKKRSQDMERFLSMQKQQQQRFRPAEFDQADRLQKELDAARERAEQRARVTRAREAAKAEASSRPGAAAEAGAKPDDKVANKLSETNRLLAEANRKQSNSFVLATIG